MLLVLMAAAALAAAEPAAAPGGNEVSPVTVPAPPAAKPPEPAAKPKQICFTERPTGSRRIQRVCYDRDVYDETRERLSRQHVRESPNLPGGRMGGPR